MKYYEDLKHLDAKSSLRKLDRPNKTGKVFLVLGICGFIGCSGAEIEKVLKNENNKLVENSIADDLKINFFNLDYISLQSDESENLITFCGTSSSYKTNDTNDYKVIYNINIENYKSILKKAERKNLNPEKITSGELDSEILKEIYEAISNVKILSYEELLNSNTVSDETQIIGIESISMPKIDNSGSRIAYEVKVIYKDGEKIKSVKQTFDFKIDENLQNNPLKIYNKNNNYFNFIDTPKEIKNNNEQIY